GLFGIIELWFVPTVTWLSWGVTLLSGWLHYAYNGPQHFPDYFFQTTSNGLFLRRMVSTYVSPLGIAYTGLLIVPLAVSLFDARRRPARTANGGAAGELDVRPLTAPSPPNAEHRPPVRRRPSIRHGPG